MPRLSTIAFTVAALIIAASFLIVPTRLAGFIVLIGMLFAATGALFRVAGL